jgi:hypothetical protein
MGVEMESEAYAALLANVRAIIESDGGRCEPQSPTENPYFTVIGGPLAAPLTMGWNICNSKGHTDAVSANNHFAHYSVCAPRMAKVLLRLLFHYHRGDELKDFADDIYDICKTVFSADDPEALVRAYEELCGW